MEKDLAIINQKRVPILTSDKVDFRAKEITRDKEVHYITMTGSIY